MKKLITIMLVMGFSIIAHARPFSSAEEIQYLSTTISRIAEVDGFTLDSSSLTLETWGSTLTTLYNVSPFRLITGPNDDRAYTVYFRLIRDNRKYSAKIHFRAIASQSCPSENNTTIKSISVLNGQESCMSLHVSPWANDLNKFITVKSMIKK